jgi:hypothetical protein
MPPRRHRDNYEAWLLCLHTCKHTSADRSRRNNRHLSYSHEQEVMKAGDIHVYHSYSRVLPLHVKSRSQHPDCVGSCAGYRYLGVANLGMDQSLGRALTPEQWKRWGLGIALLYSDTVNAVDIPQQYLDEMRIRHLELFGTPPKKSDAPVHPNSQVALPHQVAADTIPTPLVADPPSPHAPMMSHQPSPRPSPPPSTPRLSPPPSTPSPPTAVTPDPLFPKRGTLGSADPPLDVVWVEDWTRRREFPVASVTFVKTDMDPELLVRYKKAFTKYVYFIDKKGKQRDKPLPRGEPNARVFEHVSVEIHISQVWTSKPTIHRSCALMLCAAGE